MNERIKELIKQATEHDYTTWDSYNQKELVYYKFNQEKFAELIVRECISELEKIKRSGVPMPIQGGLNLGVVSLKEHFGVEE
jgi:hypothetical protein